MRYENALRRDVIANSFYCCADFCPDEPRLYADSTASRWQAHSECSARRRMGSRVDKCFLPDYPQLALASRVAGSVSIALCLSPQGAVTNYTLLSGHPLLAPPALAAIEQWKFQPAAGAACSRVRALFSFRPDGTTSVALAHAILPDHYGDPGLPNVQRGAEDTTIVQRPANAPECEAAVLR